MQKGIVFFGIVSLAICFQAPGQPAITKNPEDRAAAPGGRVAFSVAAEGLAPLQYQWQFNGQDLPNARGRVLSLVASPTRAGTYSVRVADANGERRSAPANLQVVRRPAFIVQPRNTVVGVHATAQFTITMNDSAPYSRMIWHNSNPLEGSHEIPPNAADGVDEPTLTIADCADTDSYNGIYWIAVTNSVGGTKSRRVRLTVISAPEFKLGPQDRTVRRGGGATFQVITHPDQAPWRTYQWYKDEQPIAGATGRFLRVSRAQPEDAGFYSCAVTTIGGSRESNGALLTVQ
ncbi:MAG TPA: immunoglobulin domain-containing protein [Candidatus Acidoferrum sp.]|nr:immunoglobulin domain-containing protein [Candidatus Acidoferrum sp.]